MIVFFRCTEQHYSDNPCNIIPITLLLFRKGGILPPEGSDDHVYDRNTSYPEVGGLSDRRVRILCAEGKIPGAFQEGRGWKIPADAVKPADGRFKSTESLLDMFDRKKAELDTRLGFALLVIGLACVGIHLLNKK